MRTKDVALLLMFGVVIWIAGTIFYACAGRVFLEATSLLYWLGFFTLPMISAAICVLILRWRRIPPANWAAAMLLLAIPGMIGEAIVLTNLTMFMPRLHASSGPKYGAFLFLTYAVVLGLAEVVTLKRR